MSGLKPMIPWLDALSAQSVDWLASDAGVGARAYLERRLIARETWEAMRTGFVPQAAQGVTGSPEFVRWARRGLYGRLVFPLTDAFGNVLGVQTRTLTAKTYEVFFAAQGDVYPVCYGLGPAARDIWSREHAVLVEGVFDALAVRHLVPHVVACLRAKPPVPLVRFLDRTCARVTALLDMDTAGREGVDRLIRDPHRFTVSAPAYAAHDPAELWAQGRREWLTRHVW